jgi:hypothetical protein
MKKTALALATLLLMVGISKAQLTGGFPTGTDYVIVNTPVGLWSQFDPFWVVNKTSQPITLKRIYAQQIGECIGQQNTCPSTKNFRINTFCGAAHGGNLIWPVVIQPETGCLTYFQWRPVQTGMRTWVITFETDDPLTALSVATQGTGQ